MTELAEFSKLSIDLEGGLDKNLKKEHGVFFTPKTYRTYVIQKCQHYFGDRHPETILEPSFGSGEFIADIAKVYPSASIVGVEYNPAIFDRVQTARKELGLSSEQIKLINQDFLEYRTNDIYDLIIGNPPYVVMKQRPKEYKDIITGRTNLYCLFIYKCIQMLKEDGLLAFVLPHSICNTSYYNSLRKYICEQCDVYDMYDLSEKALFNHTSQATLSLILRKNGKKKVKEDNPFIVTYEDRAMFNINAEYINKRLDKCQNLYQLGIGVKTGNVVWNEHKSKLTNERGKGTLLIYSSNVKNGKVVLEEKEHKKQYIDIDREKIYPPIVLVNRGYGNSAYRLNPALIEDYEQGFFVENHINVLYPFNENGRKNLKKVYAYLCGTDCQEYIKKFTGNGAMSKTEIQYLLPICLT